VSSTWAQARWGRRSVRRFRYDDNLRMSLVPHFVSNALGVTLSL
jgi:hypothetical protein